MGADSDGAAVPRGDVPQRRVAAALARGSGRAGQVRASAPVRAQDGGPGHWPGCARGGIETPPPCLCESDDVDQAKRTPQARPLPPYTSSLGSDACLVLAREVQHQSSLLSSHGVKCLRDVSGRFSRMPERGNDVGSKLHAQQMSLFPQLPSASAGLIQ